MQKCAASTPRVTRLLRCAKHKTIIAHQVGPALHLGCKAFSPDNGCSANLTAPTKYGNKKKSEKTRVVGGAEATSPMPWMVSC